jgi:hypothetical protein
LYYIKKDIRFVVEILIMTAQKQAEELAKSLGTQIESEYYPESRSYDIQIPAPDGKQWKSGQCIHLVGVYYTYHKGDKNEAYLDLLDRMNEGLEDIDETINPQ